MVAIAMAAAALAKPDVATAPAVVAVTVVITATLPGLTRPNDSGCSARSQVALAGRIRDLCVREPDRVLRDRLPVVPLFLQRAEVW